MPFDIKRGRDAWELLSNLRQKEPPGFEVNRSDGPGWTKSGVWSPVHVKSQFEGGQQASGNAVPTIPNAKGGAMRPKDVVDAVLGKESHGLRVGPDVLSGVVERAAAQIANKFKGFAAVVPMPTTKVGRPSEMLAKAVAARSGAKVMPFAVLKQQEPMDINVNWDKVSPKWRDDPAFVRELQQNLERIRAEIRNTGTFRARNKIPKKFMKLFSGLHQLGMDALEVVTDHTVTQYPSLLLVDDVTSTGDSMNDAGQLLSLHGFKVVGMASIFKMQDSPR